MMEIGLDNQGRPAILNSFTCSFLTPPTQSHGHPLNHMVTYSITWSSTQSHDHLLNHMVIHSITWSPTQSHGHPLNHMVTHSLTHTLSLAHSLDHISITRSPTHTLSCSLSLDHTLAHSLTSSHIYMSSNQNLRSDDPITAPSSGNNNARRR